MILARRGAMAGSALHDTTKKGEFQRKPSTFRNWVKEGAEFAPEPHRYHLCASWIPLSEHKGALFSFLFSLSTTFSPLLPLWVEAMKCKGRSMSGV